MPFNRCKNCGKIIPYSDSIRYCRKVCMLMYLCRLEIRNQLSKILRRQNEEQKRKN